MLVLVGARVRGNYEQSDMDAGNRTKVFLKSSTSSWPFLQSHSIQTFFPFEILFIFMCVGVMPACMSYAPCVNSAHRGQKKALDQIPWE